MDLIIKNKSEELHNAQEWWKNLEMQWKMAFNEACLGKGPSIGPPKDEELVLLLTRVNTFRFAGPMAYNPNVQQMPTNLTGLAGLKNIELISFTYGPITGIKELANLSKLRSLFVNNNKITSLQGIENLLYLEELYCQHNEIESIQPVGRLTNLHTLYVTKNKLKSLKGLTPKHGDKLRRFHVDPNDHLPHREMIRIQNECGILCKKG